MKGSRLDDWQQFVNFQKDRVNMTLSPYLQAILDNCEYVLHAQFDKNTKSKLKHKKRKQQLTDQYRQAFKALSRDQKLSYYIRFMRMITAYLQGKDLSPTIGKGMFSTDVYSRSFNLKMWKHKKMRLDRQKQILYAEKDNKIKTYILEDYIIRKSKNKDYYSFVLEAINDHPHDKSRTVHLGFKQETKLNEWMKELEAVFEAIDWKLICKEMKNKGVRSMTESVRIQRASEIGSERNRINSFEQDDMMSKSVIVDGNSKKQVVFVQDRPYQTKFDPDSLPQAESISQSTVKEQQFFSGQQQDQEQTKKKVNLNRKPTIIEQIAKINDIEQIQAITSREQKKVITSQAKQNIFSRIMPEYRLQDIDNTINFGTLHDQNGIRILGHLQQPLKVKMFIRYPEQVTPKLLMNCLTESESSKQSNNQIQELQLKTLIKSQNSGMFYLKLKSYNKLYRPRDFILLRHVFTAHGVLYMVDKSIQNISFPPFTTIVRGQLCILWMFKKQENHTQLVADINMNNQGYLNDAQNVNLILKFLKGFQGINKVVRNKKQKLQKFGIFNDKWNIIEEYQMQVEEIKKKQSVKSEKKTIQSKSEESPPNIQFKKKKTEHHTQQINKTTTKDTNFSNGNSITQQKTINQGSVSQKQSSQFSKTPKLPQQKSSSQSQKVLDKVLVLKQKYSRMQQQKGEIDIKEAEQKQNLKNQTVHGIKRQFDKNGHVIVSNSFTSTRYQIKPQPKKNQIVFQEAIEGHPIWKGEWKHDSKLGGIIFINQKKIEDQKGVLKFILTKIGKNLLSGKSILNISLPVDIFCAQSNLQRLVYSLTYAPTHLQPAVKLKSPFQRLKKIIAFGISNSPLYLNMQKPFNPILGQTFQCWIDGCPVYAQQISHHPPIAALFYEGRGFKITAQLQSKVQLHMNSGCGTNDGVFRVVFEQDKMEICYITPGGEVSGLTYGDRKFNMVGKGYYWIQKQGLFLELVFNPAKKGFFSVGKQEQPIDYFEGYICKVKPQFFQGFNKKRKAPNQKQIIEKFGKVYGIWNKYVMYEQQTLLDIDKQFPAKLQYEANPLPSDANWRQDIAYRRILETTRAQSQKQRLEVFQRKDRKLRQANPNYQHHKK